MSRLTKKDLKTRVERLTKLTGIEFKAVNYNDLWHVMFKNGEMLIAGSLRECYDATVSFEQGLLFKERYM